MRDTAKVRGRLKDDGRNMTHVLEKTTNGKTLRLLMAAVLLFGILVPNGLAASVPHAYAADSTPYVGQVVNGGGTAGNSVTAHDESTFYGTSLDGALAGTYDGFICISGHDRAVCDGHGGSYSATCTSIDTEGGTATYNVVFTPDDYDSGYQMIAGDVTIHADFGGYIELYKSSSNTAITDGNACYSLAGAVYGVYSDAACSNLATTLTTDANGYAKSGLIPAGNCWMKEISAPKGYAIDTASHGAAIGAGTTATVRVSDKPQNDPADALLMKYDAASGNSYSAASDNKPQNMASLALAQYTFSYYDDNYSTAAEAQASGVPTRTWVMQTDERGYVQLVYADSTFTTKDGTTHSYFVSGDSFYRTNTNKTTLPLGTLVIQETKAPAGYLLDNTQWVQQITSSGITGDEVASFNTQTTPETIQRGDYRLVKEVPTNNDDENQELTRTVVQGCQFQIVNDGDEAVVSPQTGDLVPKGGVVCTITSDENGLASTAKSSASANDWTSPANWTGSLAFGKYIVHEVIPDAVAAKYKAQYGITLIGVDDWNISITTNGQYDTPQLVSNHIPQTPLKIVKQDSETGNAIQQPCSFQLYKADGTLVTYANHYSDQVMDTWTTQADGTVTLPMKLDEGTYTLKEIQAPEGYVLSSATATVTVSEYRTWDNPITVSFKDAPIKGTIQVAKTDSSTGAAVAGAEYTVKAKADIVTGDGTIRAHEGDTVATLATGTDGTAITGKLYLGTYIVQETKAPGGYALDTAEHEVSIAAQGQTVPVVSTASTLSDAPTTLKIVKTDIGTGSTLAGATFRVWQDGADPTCSYNIAGFSEALRTSLALQGITITVLDQQTVAAELANAEAGGKVDFNASTINDGKAETLRFTASLNDDRSISVADPTDTVKATINALSTVDPNAFDQTVTTGEDGTALLAYLHPGAYNVKETLAPQGYKIAEESTRFTVDENGLIDGSTLYTLPVADEHVEISTTATDRETGTHEGIAGRVISLTDRVAYKGLPVGKEYTITGTLMDKATGKALQADGKDVTVTKQFTPAANTGTVDMDFTYDATASENLETVVFESLGLDGTEVASHRDIADADQTVTYKPFVKTTATDKETGTHEGPAANPVTVTDKVEYKGLTPGREYTVNGTLYDQATNHIFEVDGEAVTGKTVFTPAESDGSIDVEFTFDASASDSTSVVAFEQIDRDEKTVAFHKDITDADQTVTYSAPGTALPQTGDVLAQYAWLLILAIALAAAVASFGIRQRRLAKRNDTVTETADTQQKE
jgi:hypothetical protein